MSAAPEAARIMRLTAELVAQVPPPPMELGDQPKNTLPAEGYIEKAVASLIAAAPPEGVWCFAYGSLIWKPGFDFVERRVGTISGWHRAFCLGWDRYFRGNPEKPGLMLSLDTGGVCEGVLLRLPPDALAENVERVLRREPPVAPLWVEAATLDGPIRAFAFIMPTSSPAYITGISREATADALATASGKFGSMAEYLQSTVSHLEALGIHDPDLWEMQEMVAERIERARPTKVP